MESGTISTRVNPAGSAVGASASRRFPALVGLGNVMRSDDGLGVIVAREMRRRCPDFPGTICCAEGGLTLLDMARNCSALFVVDAFFGPVPGEIVQMDVRNEPLPNSIRPSSSHTFGVLEALRLGTILEYLPETVRLRGIVGESFEPGEGLSDSVILSVPALIELVLEDLKPYMCSGLQ